MKNNLQTVASLLRLQAGSDGVDAHKALEDSVNRILAIAAVHELLMERREEEVEVADLLERLRAMLVQGIGAGKEEVRAALDPVQIAGTRATALALVFSELLQNALEHGGETVLVEALAAEWGRRARDRRRRRRDRGETASGTGLSIVRALVQDELQGSLALESNGSGLRAQSCFPPDVFGRLARERREPYACE